MIKGRRINIALKDGDSLDGQALEHIQAKGVVSLFHGLSGSNQSSYMLRTAEQLFKNGWNVLLINHRGCGRGIDLPCRNPYHSGRGEDVSDVIEWSRTKYPKLPQIAIGFSLGGSAVLNLLSGKRGEVLPDFGMAVNAPLDVLDSANRLRSGPNWIYAEAFRRDCLRTLKMKEDRGWIEKAPTKKQVKTLFDIDVYHTAPATGHAHVNDFYAACTSGPFLKNIRTPTILLSAENDPIADAKFYRDFSKSKWVSTHLEPTGGHMGYLSRQAGQIDPSWMERCILHYVSQFI